MKHLFMFTSGSYEDYGILGLYECDHEVTQEEYIAHFHDFKTRRQPLLDLAMSLDIDSDSTDGRAAMYALLEFESEHDPVQTFVQIHGMKPVQFEELWDGSL